MRNISGTEVDSDRTNHQSNSISMFRAANLKRYGGLVRVHCGCGYKYFSSISFGEKHLQMPTINVNIFNIPNTLNHLLLGCRDWNIGEMAKKRGR